MSIREDQSAREPEDAGEPEDAPGQRDGRRRARRGWKIALGAVAGVVIVLVVGTVGMALWVRSTLANNIDTFSDPFESLATRAPAQAVEDGQVPATNILLLGSDSREVGADPAQWQAGSQRADAIMIVQVSGDRQNVAVMSLPRDSWVEIPGHGQNKLNAAYSLGGPSLMVATVEQLTAIHLDHVVVADFSSFTELTDALGGVTINLTHEQELAGTTFPAGAQRLNGEQALAYTRERMALPDGDLDRVQRQQAWLRAILSEALSRDTLTDPVKLYSFLDAVTSTLAVDESFTTGVMQDLAVECRGVRSSDMAFMTVPIVGTDTSADGQSIVVLDTDADAALFEAYATDTVAEYLEANPGAVEMLPATVQ